MWSFAQEVGTLNLERCLALAFEHNAELIAARLDEERSEVDERSSFGRFFPSCESQFNTNLQGKSQVSLSKIRGLVRTNKSYSFDLSALVHFIRP